MYVHTYFFILYRLYWSYVQSIPRLPGRDRSCDKVAFCTCLLLYISFCIVFYIFVCYNLTTELPIYVQYLKPYYYAYYYTYTSFWSVPLPDMSTVQSFAHNALALGQQNQMSAVPVFAYHTTHSPLVRTRCPRYWYQVSLTTHSTHSLLVSSIPYVRRVDKSKSDFFIVVGPEVSNMIIHHILYFYLHLK